MHVLLEIKHVQKSKIFMCIRMKCAYVMNIMESIMKLGMIKFVSLHS